MKEFNKVIGYKDIKIELERIVDMMLNQNKYKALGVTTTRGLLLEGEPGVGKTLMARCFIKASKRKTFTIRKDAPDGDFVKQIKKTFDKAKANAPSIVFLDDVDKFANEDHNHKNAEEFVTIQSCIDDCKEYEVFVLATANELMCLPDSLLRPGRFDKTITVKAPNEKDGEDIVKHYLSKKKVEKNINYKDIARLLRGGSCAELETVINEAGVYSGFENKKEIEMSDIIRAIVRVLYNAPETLDYKDSKYLKVTAVHEAGHALACELLEPNSVTIVTVKKHEGSNDLGFTSYEQDKDYFESKHFMENRIICLLAGKAATEIVFGICDVGTSSDISRAYQIVKRIVGEYCEYGFSFYSKSKGNENLNEIDNRKTIIVQTEMERYYQKAKKLIIDNREFLDSLVEKLIENKILVASDVQKIKNRCKLNLASI